MEYSRILVIRMSSLGDVLHALPFAVALRHRFPGARISWVVHPSFAELVPGPPWVDEVISFRRPLIFRPLQSVADLVRLRRKLRAERFDLVVDLQGLFKSALVAAVSGCRNRIGGAIMREGSSLISHPIIGSNAAGHAVERNLDIARYLGAEIHPGTDKITEPEYPLPELPDAVKTVAAKLADAGLMRGTPYVVLVPAARWVSKCWPPEYYAELARRLIGDGWNVVLAGASGDRPLSEKIAAMLAESAATNNHPAAADMDFTATDVASEKFADLTGATSLYELVALIRGAGLYVSGDTGPLHIAAAAGTPLVAICGPTRPERTGPYGGCRMAVLVTPVECAGCLKKKCRNRRCMDAVHPETVHDACRKISNAPTSNISGAS